MLTATQKQWSWYTLLFIILLGVTLFTLSKYALASSANKDYVWCFDTVTDDSGGQHTLGHPPSIDASKVAESMHGKKGETVCFKKWSQAADYMTGGRVKLADDAKEEDYVKATEKQK